MINIELLLSAWFVSLIISTILGFVMAFVCFIQCKLSPTNRWHWFEIHDKDNCPTLCKEYLRRILYEIIWKDCLHGGDFIASILYPFIAKHHISLILDLCSGNCGPSTIINEKINHMHYNTERKPVVTLLTDLFPQVCSWKIFATLNKNILYSSKPIDATNIDQNHIKKILHDANQTNKDEKSVTARTIFGAFHHFPRDLCIKIFEDAFKSNDIVIIGDGFANRSFVDFFMFAVIMSVLLPYGTIKCIQFWVFQDRDSHFIKRVFECVVVLVFYSVFQFIFIHDSVVSLARFWDEASLKEMSQTALDNIHEANHYQCECIPMQTKDAAPLKGLKRPRCMPRYSGSVFVCIPKCN